MLYTIYQKQVRDNPRIFLNGSATNKPPIDAKYAKLFYNATNNIYIRAKFATNESYIHQSENWPNFVWKSGEIINLLSEARNLQGRLIGKMESLGFDLRNEAYLTR